MTKARIYHNPRCSKSRAALALLRERGVELEVVEYLRTPPDRETLGRLLRKLGLRPSDLLRRSEPEVAASGIDIADQAAVLDLMLEHPRVIERPIVEVDATARIGRPPERVLELLPPQ
jgi:arsenate reductase (glutaredoxin)